MDSCVQCGHPLGAGRFCTNCGHPRGEAATDWRSTTAERGTVAPGPTAGADDRTAGGTDADATVAPGEATQAPPDTSPWGEPPPVFEAPARPRFPLYADDTASGIPAPEPGSADGSGYDTPAWLARTPGRDEPRRRGAVLPWVIAGVTVLVAAGLGAALLLHGGGSGDTASDRSTASSPDPGASGTSPTTPPTSATGSTPSSPATSAAPGGAASDLDDLAAVAVATQAPDGVDVHGDPVSYDAQNMIDGDRSTAWRMVGDGTGQTIVISFARPVTLTSIGLVNGYAKKEPGYDGYTANRRITSVTWTFDGGAGVDESLTDTRAMQSIDVTGPPTSSVTLRIDGVTSPGPGRSGRDYTAISELRLEGTPA